MYEDEARTLSVFDETPSAARRFFFRDAVATPTPAESVEWWEKRRIPYNVAVGATGLTTLAAVNVIELLAPNPHLGGPPFLAILAYAGLANVMYTGGWVTELLLRPLFARRTPVVGATLFRYGFAFSIGLTLLPIPLACIGLLVRVLKAVSGQ